MTKEIILTDSQEECVDKIKNFLKSHHRFFNLTGKAGTGKTTVIKYALDHLLKEDNSNTFALEVGEIGGLSSYNVLGITVSHKAKSILSKSIINSRTFASSFGLKRVNNQDGSIDFIKGTYNQKEAPIYRGYKVIVIDESSMINKQMWDYIVTEIPERTKVILMGDRGQLPPIESSEDKNLSEQKRDEDSVIFDIDYDGMSHELTEIVRQDKDNPIIDVTSIIYDEIFGNNDINRILNILNQDNYDYEYDVGIEKIRYLDFLDYYKAHDFKETKVVCYRNAKVDSFNREIRNKLLNYPTKQFIAGDYIYMNDTYMYNQKGIKFNLFNSEEFLVDSVIETEIDNIKCAQLLIKTENINRFSGIGTEHVFANVPIEEGVYKLKHRLQSLANEALDKNNDRKRRSEYWDLYHKQKEEFANVSYGYSYTGHKIQGSTYDNSVVDINDILTLSVLSNKRKLQSIYTAMTRARKKVALLKK